MEFFYVVKATQKSGKEDAVIWFTAKSVARANLQLDVELEDAGIETGRGKDYVKPVRTDFPVYNDLPEESTVDYTWCKRYELQDDGRTWLPKAGAESTGAMDNTAAPETSVKVETTVESVPLENRTPAVRFAVHLTSDKYLSHITKEQQLAASGMSLDESNTYLQNLLLAKNNIPEVAELSLNAEWKLVQAIKQVFAPDETHEAEVIAAFMADWARADAGTVAQEEQKEEPVIEYPAYFEPGRYEGLPNDVYHAANGLSSTQIKDARVSLMYFNVRHVAKTISQHDNPAFIFGRATHSFVLEPEKFSDNYVLPEKMPEDVVSTTGEMVAIIKEYNATLPALMTPDELKAWIEEYNGNLTPPLSLSAGAEETANSYMSLPEEFQRIPAETKPTATAMKACIKEYNASLKPMLKTSGTRDQLLDQIATVAPEFAEQERAKFIPYNVSGTKEQLSEIVRTIRPDVVFADDWHAQQEAANAGKETISVEMYELIKNINDALQSNNDASHLLNHPARQSEVSYFGFDEETGLEVRVRPDIEIRLPYESICADLKTVSLGYVRQDKLKDRLHREIIDRDYHLSAAMYCDVAGLDKFTWIFVNKDPGYHWVAVVDASPMLLELGRKEYRRALRQIEEAMETGYWPAPITEAYTDDLNDYDTRRLEALDTE